MKNISVVFTSLILTAAMLLSGCANANNESTAKETINDPMYSWGDIKGETITLWGDRGDLSRSYMKRVFANYEAATGNKINVVPLTKQELDERVPLAFNSDMGGRPDILFSYGGTTIEGLNPDENFYDFTDSPWVNDLIDTAINQTIFNGKVMGLPHGESSVSGTLYNKEIFKEYNIKIPTTQQEFLRVCEVLLQQGITPVYLPYEEITMLLYQFPMDSIVDDRRTLTQLNDGTISYYQMPEMRKIIDWYKTMSDSGYFGKDYTKNNWDGMDGAMKNGQYAMMLCWDTWLYTNFTGDASKIGLMPAFMGIPENGCFEGANIAMLMVNKKSPKLDAALDFINFAADPYNYNETFKGLYASPLFKNQHDSLTTPQYVEAERIIEKLFYDSMAWSRIKGFSQIDAQYIQKYMQNECTAVECLMAMDEARKKRASDHL